MTPPDDAWLGAVGRRLGGRAVVTGRAALAGGYVAEVTRVDLDVAGTATAVVVKQSSGVEVAALRALAVIPGWTAPRLLAAGPDWVVTPFLDGAPLAEGPDVPAGVWRALDLVHDHWLGKRPRGVPVADPAWWRHLCLERIHPHLRAAHERTGEQVYADGAAALTRWAVDEHMLAATAALPRTLVHGDAHRGNILCTGDGPVLIDWGNARVAPRTYDLAVLHAQGAPATAAYPTRISEVERRWGEARANVGYLGFAADHLGAGRVEELLDAADAALAALRGPHPHPTHPAL